jgi:hypothetical protein
LQLHIKKVIKHKLVATSKPEKIEAKAVWSSLKADEEDISRN